MSRFSCALVVDVTALYGSARGPVCLTLVQIRIGHCGGSGCLFMARGGGGGALFGGGGGVNQDWLAHRPIPEVRSSRACGDSLLHRVGA